MLSNSRGAICIFGKYMQNNLPLMLGPINYPSDMPQPVRYIKKHWNPKFKKLRREKVIKIELPNFEKSETELTPEQVRTEMRKLGIVPRRTWTERPIYFASTPNIFETYVVPEGDGKFSAVTKEGAKQKFEFLEKKSKSYVAVRKIKSYDNVFHIRSFPFEAMDIYVKAHEALADKNKDELIKYVTEAACPQMMHNITNKTIHWKFLESLEPPRIVHARVTSLMSKDNVFAQVTVRFHTQQVLAIYDRFGRLIQGSEILRKDVLEYIVFERHLSNQYGIWRIHGKIIPSWMDNGELAEKTYVVPKKKEPEVSASDAVPEISETVPLENVKETTKELS